MVHCLFVWGFFWTDIGTLCSKTYTNFDALQVHISNVHELGPKEHVCDLCENVAYRTRLELQNHNRIHRDGEQTCDKCGKTGFKSIMHLKNHLKIHSGIKPHQCDLCQKKFLHKSDLTLHVQRVHEKRRDYLCTQCGQGFSDQRGLNIHIKTGELLTF